MEQEKCKTCGRPTTLQRETGLCCAGEKCLSLLGNQWSLGNFDLNELHVWYQIAVKAYRHDAAKRIVTEFEHRLPFLVARPEVGKE